MPSNPTVHVTNTDTDWTVVLTRDVLDTARMILDLALILAPIDVARLRGLHDAPQYPTDDQIIAAAGGMDTIRRVQTATAIEADGDMLADDEDEDGIRPRVFTNREVDRHARALEPKECIECNQHRLSMPGSSVCQQCASSESLSYRAQTREDRAEVDYLTRRAR